MSVFIYSFLKICIFLTDLIKIRFFSLENWQSVFEVDTQNLIFLPFDWKCFKWIFSRYYGDSICGESGCCAHLYNALHGIWHISIFARIDRCLLSDFLYFFQVGVGGRPNNYLLRHHLWGTSIHRMLFKVFEWVSNSLIFFWLFKCTILLQAIAKLKRRLYMPAKTSRPLDFGNWAPKWSIYKF